MAAYIEETICSVLDQGYPNLEYIILDGKSTDGTVAIIQKYENQLAYWHSQKDKGMYDAIQQGFDRGTGEIMGWLNADDCLLPKSLFVIAKAFTEVPEVNWIQGAPLIANKVGQLISSTTTQGNKYFFYSRQGQINAFIQQESTYWRRSLWESAGGKLATEFRYAADFELWMRFFEHSPLHCLRAPLASFRFRRDEQLSALHVSQYHAEMKQIIDHLHPSLSPKDRARIRFIQAYESWGKYLSALFPSLRHRYQNLLQIQYLHYDIDKDVFSLK